MRAFVRMCVHGVVCVAYLVWCVCVCVCVCVCACVHGVVGVACGYGVCEV